MAEERDTVGVVEGDSRVYDSIESQDRGDADEMHKEGIRGGDIEVYIQC